MAGEECAPLKPAPVAGLRLGVPQGLLLTEWDNTVGTRFGAARKRLSDAGVRITDEPMPLLDEMLAVNAKGGFAPAEAFAIHREHLARRADEFDPNVRVRIERGGKRLGRRLRRDVAGARAAGARDGCAGCPRSMRWCCRPRRSLRRRSPRCRTPSTFDTKNMLLLRNTLDVEFLRHVRDLDSDPGLRPAGRADAGRAQRPRPPPVRDRGRDRAAVSPREACVRPSGKYVIRHNNIGLPDAAQSL